LTDSNSCKTERQFFSILYPFRLSGLHFNSNHPGSLYMTITSVYARPSLPFSVCATTHPTAPSYNTMGRLTSSKLPPRSFLCVSFRTVYRPRICPSCVRFGLPLSFLSHIMHRQPPLPALSPTCLCLLRYLPHPDSSAPERWYFLRGFIFYPSFIVFYTHTPRTRIECTNYAAADDQSAFPSFLFHPPCGKTTLQLGVLVLSKQLRFSYRFPILLRVLCGSLRAARYHCGHALFFFLVFFRHASPWYDSSPFPEVFLHFSHLHLCSFNTKTKFIWYRPFALPGIDCVCLVFFFFPQRLAI